MSSENTPTFKELIEAITPHFPDWDMSISAFRGDANFQRKDGACFTLYAHSIDLSRNSLTTLCMELES